MKKIALGLFSFLLATAAIAQNKTFNDKNAQPREAKNFHGIKVSNGIHLYLSQGNEEAVAVSAASDEYVRRIKTEVDNGILKIYYDHGVGPWSTDGKSLRAYVSFKTLDQLKANSGAEVEVDGTIKSGDLAFDFSSGASFNGRVESNSLKVEQNSGAETKISGVANNLTVEASSGSSFRGYDLETESCDANTSSGATLKVTVKKEMSASASSGGQIYFKGTGVIKDISTSSGGEVSKR
ncbi:MAG: head GIN domain-containing protein [Chitinophagales bacterium]